MVPVVFPMVFRDLVELCVLLSAYEGKNLGGTVSPCSMFSAWLDNDF